jgi:hypothetical protein
MPDWRSIPGFLLGTLAGVALGLLAGVSRAADALASRPVGKRHDLDRPSGLAMLRTALISAVQR